MKKILAVIFGAAIAASLCACSGSGGSSNGPASTPAPAPSGPFQELLDAVQADDVSYYDMVAMYDQYVFENFGSAAITASSSTIMHSEDGDAEFSCSGTSVVWFNPDNADTRLGQACVEESNQKFNGENMYYALASADYATSDSTAVAYEYSGDENSLWLWRNSNSSLYWSGGTFPNIPVDATATSFTKSYNSGTADCSFTVEGDHIVCDFVEVYNYESSTETTTLTAELYTDRMTTSYTSEYEEYGMPVEETVSGTAIFGEGATIEEIQALLAPITTEVAPMEGDYTESTEISMTLIELIDKFNTLFKKYI